jgi:hypothetical protein
MMKGSVRAMASVVWPSLHHKKIQIARAEQALGDAVEIFGAVLIGIKLRDRHVHLKIICGRR